VANITSMDVFEKAVSDHPGNLVVIKAFVPW
jgi:hypothetical protein